MISNKILAFLLLFGSSLCAKEIQQSNIISLDTDVRIFHTKNGFSILENGKIRSVRSEHIDKELRDLTNKELDLLLGNKAIVTVEGKKMEFTRVPEVFAKRVISHNESEAVNISIADDILSQLPSQNHIKVIKYENGDFGLKFKVNMAGGGVWGAIGGAWLGKTVASIVCHGAIAIVGIAVSAVATPMVGWAVVTGLEGSLGVTIEATTTAAAVAGGITGAVITGPV